MSKGKRNFKLAKAKAAVAEGKATSGGAMTLTPQVHLIRLKCGANTLSGSCLAHAQIRFGGH